MRSRLPSTVLIDLFSLSVTAEALQANIDWDQSYGLLVTAKHLTLVHRKARSGFPIRLN